jgi:hypothetical protein
MNKYVLIISIILNAVLLMIMYGIVPFLLFLSLVINIGFVWFSLEFLREKNRLQEDFDLLFSEMESFADHIEDVHALEAFYGDQTLQSLITHSRTIINRIVDFQEKHYEIEVIEDEPDTTEEAPPS